MFKRATFVQISNKAPKAQGLIVIIGLNNMNNIEHLSMYIRILNVPSRARNELNPPLGDGLDIFNVLCYNVFNIGEVAVPGGGRLPTADPVGLVFDN